MKFSFVINFGIIIVIIILCLSIPVVCANNGESPNNSSNTMSEEDLQVLEVNLPVSEGIVSPGSSIHPSVTIRNEGTSGLVEDREVEVKGYLNDTQIIGTSVKILTPLPGQDESYSLVFRIPENLEYGNYRLFLDVEPGINTVDKNITNNKGRAGGMVSLTPPDDNSFIGCEACWKNYR